MIRLFIVADSNERSEAMAAAFEEDDRFEISELERADLILCVGVSLQRLPRRGKEIVAISNDPDSDAPFDETLKAWLPARVKLEEVTAALMAAASGLTILTRQQAKRAFRPAQSDIADKRNIEQLTAREIEVLQMLAGGSGNKEIASRLSISPNTSKFHVAQILAKLGATSRTEAVSKAIRRGLVPI